MKKKTREEAIEELSLMLMYLTRFQDNNEFYRFREISWKGYDFGALDQLEEQGMLIQPRKSKCIYNGSGKGTCEGAFGAISVVR